MIRTIEKIVLAHRQREGGGFVVRRPLGGSELRNLDPFLMLDHLGPIVFGPGEGIGAPDHPHRGFDTVTYIKQGSNSHRDSAGNSGTLGPGWVQWMTAGSGVVHSEMPSDEINRTGGTIEGFQLWINLKAKDKMSRPRYQDTPPSDIPVVTSPDEKLSVKAICGEYNGAKSTIETLYPMLYFDVRISPGGVFEKDYDAKFNSFIFVYNDGGSVQVVGKTISEGALGVIKANSGSTLLRVENHGSTDAWFLFGAGEPLKEPIVQYGPFVMNTKEEIEQAMRDYQSGRLGRIEGAEERYRKTEEARRQQQRTGKWAQDEKSL